MLFAQRTFRMREANELEIMRLKFKKRAIYVKNLNKQRTRRRVARVLAKDFKLIICLFDLSMKLALKTRTKGCPAPFFGLVSYSAFFSMSNKQLYFLDCGQPSN